MVVRSRRALPALPLLLARQSSLEMSPPTTVSPRKVSAAKFKKQCLSLLDELEPEGIVVTKHGRPIARVTPVARESTALIGALRGRIRVDGDLTSSGLDWNARR